MTTKAAPFPGPSLSGANTAAMQFDKLFGNSQAESQSTMIARCRRVSLMKAVEDSRQKLNANPQSAIGDRDFNMGVNTAQSNLNPSSFGSEFYGVIYQIPNYLLQA